MREYFFTYMVKYHTLTWTEYARIFYYHDFWRTLSFPPDTTILYLMISCEGKLRNGTKYAELVYLLAITGNSGVQKHMAYRGKLMDPYGSTTARHQFFLFVLGPILYVAFVSLSTYVRCTRRLISKKIFF